LRKDVTNVVANRTSVSGIEPGIASCAADHGHVAGVSFLSRVLAGITGQEMKCIGRLRSIVRDRRV
jgi:hypothetical protein